MILNLRKLAPVLAGTASIVAISTIGLSNAGVDRALRNTYLSSSFSSIAWANAPFQYNPPNRGVPKTTVGAGSRGCTQSIPISVALLVPNDHNGQTVSGHPTFLWYVSDKTSVPIQFSLVEPGVSKPLYLQQMSVEKSGIVQVQLPKELPALEVGKKYRWSVSLICDSNRPSNNVFVQSWIERVSPSAELTQKLAAVQTGYSSAQTLREQARVYAQAGIWYNALEDLARSYTANPNDPSISADFMSLLEQAGLSNVSAQERQRLAIK
ncbi:MULTISPECIES: DUF928 domain-containing protein [Aerosakkonema]|uniref:DUF928 domain-containing protein n=1 Tax=Aerosakkonema TaxID=1246629 RepID=UPI0035BB5ACA